MPTLPFVPESVESMQARFVAAVAGVWDVSEEMLDRPGMHREHVFDFGTGLRLLISRDKIAAIPRPEIHISASWEHDAPKTLVEAARQVSAAYQLLGGSGSVQYIGASGGGIPHFVVVEVN